MIPWHPIGQYRTAPLPMRPIPAPPRRVPPKVDLLGTAFERLYKFVPRNLPDVKVYPMGARWRLLP
jgi:hypothetical protein